VRTGEGLAPRRFSSQNFYVPGVKLRYSSMDELGVEGLVNRVSLLYCKAPVCHEYQHKLYNRPISPETRAPAVHFPDDNAQTYSLRMSSKSQTPVRKLSLM